jgi:hypothetical protein
MDRYPFIRPVDDDAEFVVDIFDFAQIPVIDFNPSDSVTAEETGRDHMSVPVLQGFAAIEIAAVDQRLGESRLYPSVEQE